MSVRRISIAADTSFLINLFATRMVDALLDLDPMMLLVPTAVYEEVKRNRTDLDRLVSNQRAQVMELSISALRHYVNAAAVVDDGEAATIALSLDMGIGIATDDGRASDYWAEMTSGQHQRIIGICDLLRTAEQAIAMNLLREALTFVRRDANFAPPRLHADWWNRVSNGGQ